MNTTVSKSFGLALLLAVGIIAVMVAMGTFSAQKVGADVEVEGEPAATTGESTNVLLSGTSVVGGATGLITVMFDTDAAIGVGQDISIKLTDFGVPSSINASSVLVTDGTQTAQPLAVTTSGSTVIVTVGDMSDADGAQSIASAATVTVRLLQSSGITYPTAAGRYGVEVKTTDSQGFVKGVQFKTDDAPDVTDLRAAAPAESEATMGQTEGELTTGLTKGEVSAAGVDVDTLLAGTTTADTGADPVTYTFVYTITGTAPGDVPYTATDGTALTDPIIGNNGILVERKRSLSKTSGIGGAEVTISGTGYNRDISAVFIDKTGGTSMAQDVNDEVLGSVAVDKGAFSLTVTVDDRFGTGENEIYVQDAGGKVEKVGTYTVKPSLTIGSASVRLGEKFVITLSHFPDGTPTVKIANNEEVTESRAGAKVTVTVPSVGLAEGTHRVEVTVDDATASGSITVAGLPLNIAPASAVPGQEVTIRGTGFTPGSQVKTIEIGDEDVVITGQTIRVNQSGTIVATVKIPKAVAKTGAVLVEVRENSASETPVGNGRLGIVDVNIPKPAVTLDIESSRPGDTVSASGSGYVAGSNISIKYKHSERAPVVTSVNADSTGSWEKTFTIPIDAPVGKTHTVTAESIADGQASKTADAIHKTPSGSLTVSPTEGPPGTEITITADGFKAYSAVVELSIGELTIPHAGINTDENGDFQMTTVLPALPMGRHTLFVGVGGSADSPDNSESLSFTITDAPSVKTVGDAFAALIENGSLQTIWAYDFDTGGWSSYTTDAETAFANDLFEVESGDILYINVTGEQSFSHQKGETLPDGWSLITLK